MSKNRQQQAVSGKQKKAILYCDGASSGNPGDSGIGILLAIGDQQYRISEYIGTATNNIAEYTALVKGIKEAKRHGAVIIDIHTDSELMVKQINGQYRVKSENLIELYEQAVSLLKGFKSYNITHIPREKNAEADNLAKRAIKNRRKV
jgi:ribonuclease HI